MTDLEQAPPLVLAAYRRSMDSLRIIHDASDPIDIRPTATTSPCMARKKPSASFSDDELDKRVHVRMSTGSFSGREVDWQRHTFSAVPTSLHELARRSTDELHLLGSHSVPPHSAPSSSSTRCGTHVQHLRVYGRQCDADNNGNISAGELVGDEVVDVFSPVRSTVWTRGRPATIEWEVVDVDVKAVQIELLEEGSGATTIIAKEAANNGSFSYAKVPWGMACGDKYFLRISSTTDPTRYMTTDFFSIGSAP